MSTKQDDLIKLLTAVNKRCDILYDESHRAYLDVATVGFIGFVLHPVRHGKLMRAHENKTIAFYAMSKWRDELSDELGALTMAECKEAEDFVRKYIHEERN